MTTEMLERLAGAWDEAGVRWALLRGRATLDTGSDVDLLVHRDDLARFEGILLDEGGVSYPRWAHPWHLRFLVQGIELDVVTELRYCRRRPVSTGLEDGCLERRERDGWLWELAPTDMFWTVLLHCLLDKKEVTERRAAELWATLPFVDRPSAGEQVIAAMLPPGWSAARLLALVYGERWDELERLAHRLAPRSVVPPGWTRATGMSRAAAAHLAMRTGGLVGRHRPGERSAG